MQKLALGSSCHDGEAAVGGDGLAEHLDGESHACADHHDGACICEVPKAPAKATGGWAPALGHLMALAQSAPSFTQPLEEAIGLEVCLAPAPNPPAALVFPLLI